MTTQTLLQQAFDALHPQANRAFIEATKDALREALAQPAAPVVPDGMAPPFDFSEWHGNLMMLADAYWEASAAARHRYRKQLRAHALNAGQHWKARAMIAATPQAVPAPAVREPLTDEQLAKIAVEDEFLLYCDQDSFNEIARAIEQAHGITGAGNG